ncbi:MAG: alkaline phosphatase [Wenzhouxiangella sp.]
MIRNSLILALAASLWPMAWTLAAEESPAGWYRDGENLVAERRERLNAERPARNVILFLGDGMSLSTVSAARILAGQKAGGSGEENLLYFERFPYLALAKTYNTNQQTPDSAGTMTAIVTGVKTFAGALAVDQRARRGDCASIQGNELVTLLDIANLAGMATGVVTDTRITHATPAALYARVPDRNWESDNGIPPSQRESGCHDIARQLIDYDLGGPIDVVLGGGRRAFMTSETRDPEYPDVPGHRSDGRDLISRWQRRFPQGHYVWNQADFDGLPSVLDGPVLGLFEPSHMHYEIDRDGDEAGEPSLSEMTRRSIEWLSSNDQGFFLMVEGGRIDHAHHINNAYRALTNTIEFARAIEVAASMVSLDDTLIVVTADHGHAMTFGSYGERGNPIAGLAVRPGDGPAEERIARDQDGVPITVLRYHDGPGFRAGNRPDFDQVDPTDPDYLQESTFGVRSASHSGEDVPVYSIGPGAEVLTGVIEQNVIFHAMLQAVPALAEMTERLRGAEGFPDWQAARRYQREQACSAAQRLTIGEC